MTPKGSSSRKSNSRRSRSYRGSDSSKSRVNSSAKKSKSRARSKVNGNKSSSQVSSNKKKNLDFSRIKATNKRKIISQAVNRTKMSMLENFNKNLFKSDLNEEDNNNFHGMEQEGSNFPNESLKVFNNDEFKSSIRRANDNLEKQYNFMLFD